MHAALPTCLAPVVLLFLSMTLASGHIDSKGYEIYSDKYGAVINSFKLHKKKLAWVKAKAKCIEENAHLVIPNTISEVRVLKVLSDKFYQNNSPGELHVGFEKNMNTGDWITVLGEPMEDALLRPLSQLWRTGEPNNAGGSEFCVSMDMGPMKYLDVNCNDTKNVRAFVCEKEIVDQEEPDVDERLRV